MIKRLALAEPSLALAGPGRGGPRWANMYTYFLGRGGLSKSKVCLIFTHSNYRSKHKCYELMSIRCLHR